MRVVIMGAAGRDFHNLNMVFRENVDWVYVSYSNRPRSEVMRRATPRDGRR